MTVEEACLKLENLSLSLGLEESHIQAEDVLVQFLHENGFSEVANAFERTAERLQFVYS